MDRFATCSSSAGSRFLLLLPSSSSFSGEHQRRRSVSCRRRRRSGSFPVFFASRDGGGSPELDRWDQMELKFGRLLGEDPKLTLAKIMGRKVNPEVSYLDIEKSFHKKKGKSKDDDVVIVPFDTNLEEKSTIPMSPTSLRPPTRPQNAIRDKNLSLLCPPMTKGIRGMSPDKKPTRAAVTPSGQPVEKVENKVEKVENKSGSPNVALRKPNPLEEDDFELEKPSMRKIKPNLLLKMRKDPSDGSSDVTLLKKPEVMKISLNPADQGNTSSSDSVTPDSKKVGSTSGDAGILDPSESTPTATNINNSEEEYLGSHQENSFIGTSMDGTMDVGNASKEGPSDNNISSLTESSEEEHKLKIGLQPPKQSGVAPHKEEDAICHSLSPTSLQYHAPTALKGKPQRFDTSVKKKSHPVEADRVSSNDNGLEIAAEVKAFVSAEQEEREDDVWRRAEDLLQSGERTEVEFISYSSRGFVVSFDSVIGFLPYRNLGTKWKFLAFESWLRKKGLDPSLYRQKLTIVGSYDVQNKNIVLESSENSAKDLNDEERLASDMNFEDLLEMYDQEKTKYLSSFIGQRIKVSPILVDQNSRRLMFSGRPKEKEELVERKRSLMAKLSIGDVVKCCIKKITYFGIFVEVEGVPALIHQSEVSWDSTLDPSSFFKIGQIVDAKVHQLDYALERITLSLKEITPDPLNEALESVVGDRASFDGSFEAAQGDVEWADVESLIKELQKIDGVISVSKGRFFLSPGLAPTFQVYMGSVYDNQYKLLARYGNKVQEVMVQSSLDKEQMKASILTCTNRVE